MSMLKSAIRWTMVACLMIGWAGCQQPQATDKPGMAKQCPTGCKCPQCTKQCDKDPKQCDKDTKAKCPMAAQCDKVKCPAGCKCPKCGKPCDQAAKCPAGCKCPKCSKACDQSAKAGCPMAGKPGCNPAACPMAKGGIMDKVNGPKGEGWIPLCNGKDMGGWKSMSPNAPMSWKVVDNMLVNEKAHGVNIYTEQKFGDLEFYAEYKLPPGGNSGIFLQGLYEIQIIDDFGVPVEKPKDSGNGGMWSMKPPCKNVSKPAGEWQSIYAKLVGSTVTIILNGEKIIDNFKMDRPTHYYDEMKAVVKPGEPGPILLQGDHKPIEYRNVMVRPIK